MVDTALYFLKQKANKTDQYENKLTPKNTRHNEKNQFFIEININLS
ncbi:Uncharacterized protein YP598_1204 [Yersinia pseudotuberculosis]|uniref:Uncharacterized protein n=1 Tax=Yersinia pseudotuberculosis serotype O:1b (strain IP 31758) TaxID=349747 RepID=A0A0U1QWY1_YERP3|nr:hypothetical protein YpsIP31758_1178 [Yersinia pseudotuberculosis IP 31758]UFA60827.1 Uncharacterized protein YP598_1204 [Yersinia pseudotuberculosis]